jgi:hypothetical protein
MFAPAVLAPYLPPGQHAPGLPMPPYAAPGMTAGPVNLLLAGAPRTGPYVPAACRSGAAGNVAVEATTVAAAEVHAMATFTADAPDMAPWDTVSPDTMMQEPLPQPGVVSPLAAVSAAPRELEQAAAPAASPGTLPWIDAFLRSTPAMPMRAVEAQVETAVETDDVATEHAEAFEVGAALEAPASEEIPAEVFGSVTVDLESDADDLASPAWIPQASEQPASEQPVAALTSVDEVEGTDSKVVAEAPESIDIPEAIDMADATTELWPLADAAAAFRDLSVRLDQRSALGQDVAPAASSEPALAPWADDDFMDVMPVSVSSIAPEGGETNVLSGIAVSTAIATEAGIGAEGHAEHVAVTDPEVLAHEPIDVYGGATVPVSANVAFVLERLAHRMRAGELSVPSYDARLGEQAALVAALAAVLGVRSL